ncbi:MAG TPA: serine--tRNA ligase [Candidatus Levybacteria bacterium]|nr:serine--tRNA ligase [Candidatus Levybacteria bacterium]
MLDIKYIQENPEKVQQSAADKGVAVDVGGLLDTDREYREISTQVQNLRAERNVAAKSRDIEKGKELKVKLDELEPRLKELEEKLQEMLWTIPNPAKDDVKIGKDDTENEVIRTYGEPTTFSFKPRDHVELGQLLDIIDIERATKVSGSRFYYLKNQGVLLEQALVRYAMDTLIPEGFIPIIPPVLITEDTMKRLGYMEHGGDEDMFRLEKDKLVLVATAEHAIAPIHKDEVLSEEELPKRYVGYSPSFRREAGSYGKDTRGILRVHQFNKVEMVSFVKQGEDDTEHEFLLGLEEKFFQELNIPHQVVKMCTGDLGFPAARKYDIEAWIPTQEKYREVTSVSTVTDFQSRRLNTKYRTKEGTEYVQILNGTAFSIGRPIIAILENFQQEDGTVIIPEILRKYTGFDKISPSA